MTLTAFFGDAEYQFKLTPEMIRELERKCGAIGGLSQRVFIRQFAQADLVETIRCALVGAGMAPKLAATLVATYAEGRPLFETYELAARILERCLFGAPHHEKDNSNAG